jgi:histidinol-phosphate phosphatase family protein
MTDRAVFIDRDGTMAIDVHYCRRPEDFELYPETAGAVRRLNEYGFKVIVITNQSGIARGYFDEAMLAEIHREMKRQLALEGAAVDGIYCCPHHPDEGCDCRKPEPKLILRAIEEHDIDPRRSFVVGDLQMDIDLGRNAGCKTALVRREDNRQTDESGADYVGRNLSEIVDWIAGQG